MNEFSTTVLPLLLVTILLHPLRTRANTGFFRGAGRRIELKYANIHIVRPLLHSVRPPP